MRLQDSKFQDKSHNKLFSIEKIKKNKNENTLRLSYVAQKLFVYFPFFSHFSHLFQINSIPFIFPIDRVPKLLFLSFNPQMHYQNTFSFLYNFIIFIIKSHLEEMFFFFFWIFISKWWKLKICFSFYCKTILRGILCFWFEKKKIKSRNWMISTVIDDWL